MGMGDIANTGMQAAMQNMNIISNNVANAGTYGFKRSTASFADIFPSGNNASSVQSGLGVQLTSIQQDFSPGAPTMTNLPSDLSIPGSGFFMLNDANSGQKSYTRVGHFSFDPNKGYFNIGTARLQGYPATNGVIAPGSSPADLQINVNPVPAKPSANVTEQQLILSAKDSAPTGGAFNPSSPTTYNYMTTCNLYDSLGAQNNLSLYYVKSATANTWTVNAYVNGTSVGTGTMTFNPANGQLATSTGLTGLSFSPTSGAASPQTFNVDMTGATQTGSTYNSNAFTVDGYGAGVYDHYLVDDNGMLTAVYTNGQKVLSGQIAVADFQYPQALQSLGSSSWGETSASGKAVINQLNSSGNISQGTLEMSNVDLASELVSLITAQNTFQANAQVEQAYVQVMQTITKL